MHSASTTCTETSGNGWRTAGTIAMREIHPRWLGVDSRQQLHFPCRPRRFLELDPRASARPSATGPLRQPGQRLGLPGRPDAYPLNLCFFTSWFQGEALVEFLLRGNSDDGQFQAHGSRCEAHYQFLIWLMPTIENSPGATNSRLATASRSALDVLEALTRGDSPPVGCVLGTALLPRSPQLALVANSLRCNGASAAEGRPPVAQRPSSRQPMTLAV